MAAVESKKEDNVNTEHPKICCLDLDTETILKMKLIGSDVYKGSLGSRVKLTYSNTSNTKQLLLNCDLPANLHEYDITIVDLEQFDTVEYKYEDHYRESLKDKSTTYLTGSYPQTIFDPRPFGSHLLKIGLEKINNRKHLLIIFSTESYTIEYEPMEVSLNSRSRLQSLSYNIYSLIEYPPLADTLYGQKIQICDIEEDFKILLAKYFQKDSKYNQTFKQKETWVKGKYENDENLNP